MPSRASPTTLKVKVIVPPSTTARTRQGQQWRENLEKYRSSSSIYRRYMRNPNVRFRAPDGDEPTSDEDEDMTLFSREISIMSRESALMVHPTCDVRSAWFYQYVKPEWLKSMDENLALLDENLEHLLEGDDDDDDYDNDDDDDDNGGGTVEVGLQQELQPSCQTFPDWVQNLLLPQSYNRESRPAGTNMLEEAARRFLFYDGEESLPTLDQTLDDSTEDDDENVGVDSSYLLWQEEQQSWAIHSDATLEKGSTLSPSTAAMSRETSMDTSIGSYDSLVALVPQYEHEY